MTGFGLELGYFNLQGREYVSEGNVYCLFDVLLNVIAYIVVIIFASKV